MTIHSARARCIARAAAVAVCAGIVAGVTAEVTYADYRVKATIKCDGGPKILPVGGMRVELWEDELGFDDYIRSTTTDKHGRINLVVDTEKFDAEDDQDVYLKLVARRATLNLNVWDFFEGLLGIGPDSADTGSISNSSGVANFKTRIWQRDEGVGVPSCWLLLGAVSATQTYRKSIGPVPFVYNILNDAPTAGVPYTNRIETAWPRNFSPAGKATFTTSRHEFGHAVRAFSDGNYTHFLGDVLAHNYLQMHFDCKLTNFEFAFNEGWAAYWANSFETCGDPGEFRQEGNVAARLSKARACSSRKTMVRVLKSNPGTIHTLVQFVAKLRKLAPTCANTVLDAASSASAASVENEGPGGTMKGRTPAEVEQEVTARVDRLRQAITGLETRLATARSDPRRTRGCGTRAACVRVADAILLPTVLSTQLSQAKAQLSFVEATLASGRVSGFQRSATEPSEQSGSRRALVKRGRKIMSDGLALATRELNARGRADARFRSVAAAARRRLAHRRTTNGANSIPIALAFNLPTSGDQVVE